MGKRVAQRGFTLMEVLVASVVMATAFVAVVSLMSQSLRNLDRMRPHETALLHAREKMSEQLLNEQLAAGTTSGRWDDGYRWRVQIDPAPGPAPQLAGYGLFRIRVEVAWGEAREARTYALETTQWAQQAPEAQR
ncbi:MAG TPA: prepilin-type N-terminal cleavage/methylation domain-containing protein [Terriglobales bacterium]|nr:prepilin-type N-terminal cleavage/methylation domain-containing protein [Terriglobales bacterium]